MATCGARGVAGRGADYAGVEVVSGQNGSGTTLPRNTARREAARGVAGVSLRRAQGGRRVGGEQRAERMPRVPRDRCPSGMPVPDDARIRRGDARVRRGDARSRYVRVRPAFRRFGDEGAGEYADGYQVQDGAAHSSSVKRWVGSRLSNYPDSRPEDPACRTPVVAAPWRVTRSPV